MNADEAKLLVSRGAESRDLDYKGAGSWDTDDKEACCRLVKDILAMANTDGGFIVVGVEESGGQFHADGLSPEQLKSWESTKLNSFLQNYADPPINAIVQAVIVDGKTLVVISVPQFNETPHICQKDFPKALQASCLYVRTANNESAPLRDSSDFRRLVERAVRTRQEQMLQAMRGILTGAQGSVPEAEEQFRQQASQALGDSALQDPHSLVSTLCRFVTIMHPANFKDRRYSLQTLRSALANASLNYRGWPFIFIDQYSDKGVTPQDDGIMGEFEKLPLVGYDFWEAKTTGLLVSVRPGFDAVRQRMENSPAVVTDFRFVIYHVTEALDALVRYFEALGVEEPVTFALRMEGTKGRSLGTVEPMVSPFGIVSQYKAQIDTITWTGTRALEEWKAGLVPLAAEICGEIFSRFGWTGKSAQFQPVAQSLLSRNL